MKKGVPPLLAYLIVCAIVVFIPASEGYNSLGWKLFVGQLYAVPVLLVVTFLCFYINKKKSKTV